MKAQISLSVSLGDTLSSLSTSNSDSLAPQPRAHVVICFALPANFFFLCFSGWGWNGSGREQACGQGSDQPFYALFGHFDWSKGWACTDKGYIDICYEFSVFTGIAVLAPAVSMFPATQRGLSAARVWLAQRQYQMRNGQTDRWSTIWAQSLGTLRFCSLRLILPR